MADNGTIGSRNPFAIKPTTPTRGEDLNNRESRPLVAPPTLVLGGGAGAADTPRASGFVLKPSALSAQTSNLKVYTTPTRINNNGKAGGKASSDDEGTKDEQKAGAEMPSATSLQESAAASEKTGSETKSEPALLKMESEIGEVVFGQNLDSRVSHVVLPSPVESTIPAAANKESFVFGEKLHERVTNADVSGMKPSLVSEELTFAAACEKEPNGSENGGVAGGVVKAGEKRSLTETAEEHQMRLENEAKKGRLDEVEVVTGEEDESNVLQINCKLYIYEGKQYQERGRGVLRVNDKQISDDGSIQSRVVMRTQGSLRVVLNTSVWSGMKVEHPSAKSVRLTGQSPGGAIGVFVVQCTSPKDADQLFHALEWRVQALKRAQAQTEPGSESVTERCHQVGESEGDVSREAELDDEDEPTDLQRSDLEAQVDVKVTPTSITTGSSCATGKETTSESVEDGKSTS